MNQNAEKQRLEQEKIIHEKELKKKIELVEEEKTKKKSLVWFQNYKKKGFRGLNPLKVIYWDFNII